MFTAMYCYFDEYRRLCYSNARVGGYRTKQQAVRAIIRRSPTRSGVVQVGQRVISAVKNGITIEGV